MIRVVLDTNVIVSALLAPEGVPAAILDLALQREIQACASRAAFDELAGVLKRPKFALNARRIGSFLALWKRRTEWVSPNETLAVCSKDPDDNRFLECAQAARADFLVTGNLADFPRRYRQIVVVKPAEFWEEYLLRTGL